MELSSDEDNDNMEEQEEEEEEAEWDEKEASGDDAPRRSARCVCHPDPILTYLNPTLFTLMLELSLHNLHL